jgi:pectin methylesterase-like acyl-CoA thioesterase
MALGSLCLVWALSAGAGAATIHVPDDYPTIQQAIDAAALLGDTVRVHAGTYHENIVWDKKSLSLIGDGAGSTIVDGDTDGDGDGNGTCLTITNVPDTASIEGFTFQNGRAPYGGGLCLINSDLTVADNVITGNTANYGGGLRLEGSAATLTGNTVTTPTPP